MDKVSLGNWKGILSQFDATDQTAGSMVRPHPLKPHHEGIHHIPRKVSFWAVYYLHQHPA